MNICINTTLQTAFAKHGRGNRMKVLKTKVMGMALIVMLCSLLMGTSVSAGYVYPGFLSAISGTKKFAITKPKKPVTIPVGAYDGSVTVKSKSTSKNVVKYSLVNGVDNIGSDTNVPNLSLNLIANKLGKAKLTVTYTHSGGTVQRKITLITYKWGNPFKTLKIGGKNLSKAFAKTDEKTIAPIAGNLKIKMNSGYKALQVYYHANGTGGWQQLSTSQLVTLNSGDILLFRFKDNKHKVKGSEAAFFVQ